jgi:two-component system nitrate/nitrite response regulator NarL
VNAYLKNSLQEAPLIALGTSALNVLLVGGGRLLQEGTIQLLRGSRFSVCRCVPDIHTALRTLRDNTISFGLVLVQFANVSDAGFVESLSRLRDGAKECPLVLLAWAEMDPTFIASAVEAGIDGYLESNLSQESLKRALDRAVSGERVLPARIEERPARGDGAAPDRNEKQASTASSGSPFRRLSPRELQVLWHLANGDSNKVIAQELDLVEATVKVHVKSVLRKTHATNRTQAAIWAIRNGLMPYDHKATAVPSEARRNADVRAD